MMEKEARERRDKILHLLHCLDSAMRSGRGADAYKWLDDALTAAADAGEERALSQPYIEQKLKESWDTAFAEGRKDGMSAIHVSWQKVHDAAKDEGRKDAIEELRLKVITESEKYRIIGTNTFTCTPSAWDCLQPQQPYIAQKIAEAREAGRREALKSVAGGLGAHGLECTCPDCAALKAQGAEELRVKVLERLANAYRFRVDAQPATGGISAITILESDVLACLAPPTPKVEPVEAWMEAAAQEIADRNGESCDIAPPKYAAIIAKHHTHQLKRLSEGSK